MSAESYNKAQMDSGSLTPEMISELGRFWQENHPPLTVDGYIGPSTQASLRLVLDADEDQGRTSWDPFQGPVTRRPANRSEVYEIFGDPGAGVVDRSWVRENIVELHGQNGLPGVPEHLYIPVNRRIEPNFREGLRRACAASPYVIKRFGVFVFRHQRHNPSRPLSYHAWGIAGDVNPDDNRAILFDTTPPEPWSESWMRIWPNGVDRNFVAAMESCGFVWGGRWLKFKDPMHFQFVG